MSSRCPSSRVSRSLPETGRRRAPAESSRNPVARLLIGRLHGPMSGATGVIAVLSPHLATRSTQRSIRSKSTRRSAHGVWELLTDWSAARSGEGTAKDRHRQSLPPHRSQDCPVRRRTHPRRWVLCEIEDLRWRRVRDRPAEALDARLLRCASVAVRVCCGARLLRCAMGPRARRRPERRHQPRSPSRTTRREAR